VGQEQVEELIAEARLRARVAALGRRIARDYRGRELLVLCVLRGAFVFAADLVRHIESPLTVSFARASSYGGATVSRGRVRLQVPPDVRGRHVLVVEDIVDTGRTLRALRRAVASRRAASVRVCALLDKPSRREVEVDVEYVGFRIGNRFVVGYGLDHGGKYRNLPYVGTISSSS
jgi:hypoxanthine phosphoribosyltransferase